MTELAILIVSDDPLARGGLAALLAAEPAYHLVGQVDSQTAIADLELYQPQLIVWDLGWEVAPNQLTDLAEITDRWPVVALLDDVAQAEAVWQVGVRGLLRRDVRPGQLVAALQATEQDLTVLDPQLVTARQSEPSSVAALIEPLTPREMEVLQLVAEGLPNKTIAHRLSISDHTVKFHLNAILGKLNTQSRTEAVVQAIRLGLIVL